MRLVIISHDTVGQRMAGPGIRAWELARVLALHADVMLLAPQPIDLVAPGVRTGHFILGNSASLVEYLRQADVILANGFLLESHPELADARQPLILDMYDPTVLENIELFRAASLPERQDRARRDIALLNRQLTAGDLFLCATERQRDLYLGALMAAGRITPDRVDADPLLHNLVTVVPFGLPATPPVRTGPGIRGVIPGIGETDPIILWNSGMWDWLDPLTLIRAMKQVVTAIPNARLVFLAGKHPGGAAPMQMPDAARALASELDVLNRHVFFYEAWIPYADRANILLDATMAVTLHRQHLEMAYAAIRSRVLDYLWTGLPAVLSDGDPAAALARQHGFALVTPPEDREAVAHAIITLLTDEARRHELAAHARALAPRYTWNTVAQPIITFLASIPTSRLRATERSEQVDAAQHVETAPLTARRQTLQAQRNSALQALEATWRLDRLTPPAQGLPGKARNFVLDRIVWPLTASLIARQRDHNAAVIRAAYAMAEYQDHLSNDITRLIAAVRLLSHQTRDIIEHITELHEADQNLRTALYDDPPPPPPRIIPPKTNIDTLMAAEHHDE
ncbi:glycosyltransferase family 4 protein [Roseiflexus castenholzii]|uniref:Glycosyl transferase, group 1 n=1 Tax=Roseiflexus castenholzii (strain DSM 13941 / HLO8) TaxID=383372 RepID=A7NMP4_ROSCS|nr:glycosyltransferase family 4 protein [Roseiflexus castenholzii]ABU58815.1 glycosyl transferase, group 1 [Roseiflexus castenholzii DSM 13941]